MDHPPRLALGARGLCAGALGGAFAGSLDYLLAAGEVRRFLPQGTFGLLGFLLPFDAAIGALAGLALGLLVRLLATTDLGPLVAAHLRPRDPATTPPRPPAPLLAYLLALAVVLALHGTAVHAITLDALRRFHAHLPIAALVGAAAAGLAVPGVALVFLLARLFGLPLRWGPRPQPRVAAPLGWIATAAVLGLDAALVGVFALVDGLELTRRLSHPERARYTALAAPFIVLGALALAYLLFTLAWRPIAQRPLGARLRQALDRPLVATILPVAILAAAAGLGLGVTWSIAKLVRWQPFALAAAAAAVALLAAAAGLGRRLDAAPARARLALLLLPLALLGAARLTGRPDRVRKAAAATFLAPPLLVAIQALTDLDHDDFSSTLGFGPDCDDQNPEVHPGAFDWPDDGLDQNCDGHQATLATATRPPFGPLPPGLPERPSILLVTIDALRADHVGAYGYARPTTPHLDALAREAVLFKSGWAHSPSTRYSVPAILIGRYASTIAWDPRAHWPPLVLPENRLLSEALKDRGYRTAALVPAHYFEPGWGLTQGFDDYDNSLARLHANPFGGDPARTTGSSSAELADLGIAWLERHAQTSGDAPFFLWMHFYDPHYLYERHAEVPDFGPGDIDRYDGEVRFTDLHIGRVLEALRRSGQWERTIVVVTADHGEGFGEHGVKLHGYHIYAQQNRVPFIVRVPGLAPRGVEEPVGHVDLFPTLLHLARAPDEPQLLGHSLVGLMQGGKEPGRMVFGEVEYEGPVVRKSVVTRDWHLIHNVVPDDTFELYHLAEDADERSDVYEGQGADPAEQGRLRAALAAWIDQSALPPRFAERVAGCLGGAPFPVAQRLDADLGGMLILDGASVKTPVVRPGEPLELEVVMHVPARVPPGWRLYTHVMARPPTRRYLNADHEPLEGLVPLGRFAPGQYVRDRLRVVLPRDWPPGTLEVRYGLWKGAERARVQPGGADHVVVGTVEVQP